MFTRDDLLALLSAAPFTAFRLHLSDGGTVDIRSREIVMPLKRYAVVALPNPSNPAAGADRHATIDYMHVTRTEMLWPVPFPGDGTATAGGPAPAPAENP
jgi:hypothetical protein